MFAKIFAQFLLAHSFAFILEKDFFDQNFWLECCPRFFAQNVGLKFGQVLAFS
jgi:hypothetical protein|tara:strand:+ start:136 stop:294 length:159 start_codon:yes stop_codon:yes gene_type:complete